MEKIISLFLSLIILSSCAPVVHQFIPTLMREKVKDEHKICFIGDTGTGDEYQYLVAEKMLEENCDQVRLLGDVIYNFGIRSKKDPAFFDKFYLPYRDFMAQKIPFYLVMGNHDFRGSHRSWLDLAKKYPYINFPNYYYDEEWEQFCIISLDTNIYRSLKQRKWLKNVLKKHKNQCSFSIALGHHPLLSSGDHGNSTGGLKDFLDLVVGRVDLYIAGHDHNLADEGNLRGTQLLVSGAGAKIRPIQKRPEANYAASRLGYVVLTIKKASPKPKIRYVFKAIENRRTVIAHWGEILPQGIR